MNMRVVLTGALMMVLALGFFLYMGATMAPKSTDPAGMMQTVGEVSGAVGGIGLVMLLYGVFKRKRA